MTALASTLINWSALWKIMLAALIGGAGVVVAFGFALLSTEAARATDRPGRRVAHWGVASLCGLCCIGAVAIGIYTMADKPATNHAPKHKPTALTASPSASLRQAAAGVFGLRVAA